MRILIVDECEDSLFTAAWLLRHRGHEVQTARSGSEAVMRASVLRPDMIFMDLGLPRLTGRALADQLRQIDGIEDVCIIALGRASQEHQRVSETGFDAQILKPVTVETMLGVMEALQRSEKPHAR